MGDHAGAIPYCDADVLQPLNAYPSVFDRSAEQAIAADRFARKIVGILKAFQARLRQLNGNPFGDVRSSTARSRLEFKEIYSFPRLRYSQHYRNQQKLSRRAALFREYA